MPLTLVISMPSPKISGPTSPLDKISVTFSKRIELNTDILRGFDGCRHFVKALFSLFGFIYKKHFRLIHFCGTEIHVRFNSAPNPREKLYTKNNKKCKKK